MIDPTAPPPPAGYQPVQNSSTLPALPAGYSLVSGGSSAPQASASTAQPDLSSNPGAQGTYQMTGPSGQAQPVPYGNVDTARQQGYQFAGPKYFNWAFLHPSTAEEDRYNKDRSADPQMQQQLQKFASDNNALNPAIGGAKDLSGDAIGLDRLVRHIAGKGDQPLSQPETAVQNFANEPQNAEQRGGSIGANVMEFMSGEELLKMLGKTPGALKVAGQIESLSQKAPALGKTLQLGLEVAKRPELQQALVGAAQTYVKTGGDTGAAIDSGLLTGGIGAAGSAIAEGADAAAGMIGGRTTEIGGQKFLAPGEPTATPAQAAGQRAIQSNAQGTLESQLGELNESRTPEPGEEPAAAPYQFKLQGNRDVGSPPTRVIGEPIEGSVVRTPGQGTSVVPSSEDAGGQGARVTTYPPARVESPGTQPISGSGELTTTDQAVARAHLAATNEAIDSPGFKNMTPQQQSRIIEAKADTERQLDEYWQQQEAAKPGAGLSGLGQVNIPETIKDIGSHTEAADKFLQVLTNGYDQIADRAALSGRSAQTYTALKNAYQQAEEGVRGAAGTEALAAAEDKADAAHGDLVQFFNHIGVTPKEVAGVNQGYGNYIVMRDVAKAVDSAFNLNPYLSKNAGLYRGFNGDQLMDRLSGLTDKFGPGALDRVMGRGSMAELAEVAKQNSTRAGAADFGQATNAIAKYLAKAGAWGGRMVGTGAGIALARPMGVPWYIGGSLGGAAAEGTIQSGRAVYNAIATNPQIAQHVLFAINSGAKSENYVPFIAGLIQQNAQEKANQQQRGGQ